jgi:hypothetical protein
MIFERNLRRQARICDRLADDCDDPYLAERLREMALDLIAKADELEALTNNVGLLIMAEAWLELAEQTTQLVSHETEEAHRMIERP